MVNNLKARDIMHADVIIVSDDMPVQDLADLLTEKMISGVPVANSKGKLIGMASQSDIVRSRGHALELTGEKKRPEYYLHGWEGKLDGEDLRGLHVEEEDGLLVRDVMTPAIFEVDEQASLPEMARAMIRGNVHRLIVKRNDQVVGIVTTIDMLKALAGKEARP